MSNKNLNPVNANRPKRVAMVIANPGLHSAGFPVGFWWAELTHPYYAFGEAGYDTEIFSPQGGKCEGDAWSNPLDPSQWQADDVISRGYLHDPAFMKLLDHTKSVDEIAVSDFDAIVVCGGQSPMFTFESAAHLHRRFVEFFEAGKITAALCHGTSVLRYARLSNGEFLVKGRTVTGFANVEEDASDQGVWQWGLLPKGTHFMPWRIEDSLRELGANYIQAGLWKGFAVRDGNLITGQQNFSGKETARLVIDALGG
jgi:putative intracellular protease/amidase